MEDRLAMLPLAAFVPQGAASCASRTSVVAWSHSGTLDVYRGASNPRSRIAPDLRHVGSRQRMTGIRAVLAAVLACAMTACGTAAAPSPTVVASSADGSSVVVTPSAASATRTATPASPSPSPTPEPTTTATPVPVPSEPTGVTFTTDPVQLPGPSGTGTIIYTVEHTIRWKAPRTDVEIRAYGVTECLAKPTDPAPRDFGK